jgi:uncharacterized SAM-binding protein YcdF (DUF218 family)
MSHFTARGILAGFELYQQRAAARFVLPGEQRGPATSDLERAFLLRRGVAPERILTVPNRNGTLQQLEPVARLQQQGRISSVVVVCFAFHAPRVREYMRRLGIRGEIAEVEHTHATFLRERARATRVSRDELVNLPQLGAIRQAEQGISRMLLRIDRPFGRWAPATRLFKMLAGPTLTDIDGGRPRVGLARLDAALALVSEMAARIRERPHRVRRGSSG